MAHAASAELRQQACLRGRLRRCLIVKNSKRARVGDSVKIGLVQAVQFKGYPHFLGTYVGFPPMDIIAGFFSLIVVSFFSLRWLKLLDSFSSFEIVNVLYDPRNTVSVKSDQKTIADLHLNELTSF